MKMRGKDRSQLREVIGFILGVLPPWAG